MYRDLMLQMDHAQQEYERELRQLSWLGRLRRERRETREAKRQTQKTRVAPTKGVTA